jgi:hypothetical protein
MTEHTAIKLNVLREILDLHAVSVSVEGWSICNGHHTPNAWHIRTGDDLFRKTMRESRWKKWYSKTDQFIYVRDGYWRFAGFKQQQLLDMLFDAAQSCGVIADKYAPVREVQYD